MSKRSFLISYWQGMGSRAFQVVHGRLYSIRKGLTLTRKKEVALRIFMEVSLGFEAMQGSWPYSWVTDSGFSAEDLTSNLIGFYRAVEKYSWEQILQACRPGDSVRRIRRELHQRDWRPQGHGGLQAPSSSLRRVFRGRWLSGDSQSHQTSGPTRR